MRIRNTNGSSDESFKNIRFMGKVMVIMGMKVSVDVSFFPINLVGDGAIKKVGDENIQKGKRIFILDFHSKFDMG
jgi:hypothetical protein